MCQWWMSHGVEISRKVFCLLLVCVLLIQTGCQTTRVLLSLEQEDLKAEEPKRLHLKLGQLIRITYSKDAATKRQVGRVKSVTSEAMVVVTHSPRYGYQDIRISFEHINQIELLEKKQSEGDALIAMIVVLPILFLILWANSIHYD